jgi:hypothetical protein
MAQAVRTVSEPEWVDVWDGPTVADERWISAQEAGRDVLTPAVRIVDFGQFIATEEPSSEALLGTSHNTILPLDGMLLMYGDGGAGKTTLTIDAVSHLASGTPWLGIPVERPVRTLMIENEGPRGKFRQRLAEKHASWNGSSPFSGNVSVLEEPWTRFTLREPEHRETVAVTVDRLEIDLIVMGPLVTLGMVGGGTPDEVNAFEELLLELRTLIARSVSFWIVHHENKAGDISGAWERVPDALCHVQALGNGHTRLVWQKARWSDDHHKAKLDLIWADGRSFTVREEIDRQVHEEILQAFEVNDQWRTVKEITRLISARETLVKGALTDLVDRAEMARMKGPKGRHGSAVCYRLQGAPELWEHPEHLGVDGPQEQVLPEYPPPRRGGTSGAGGPVELAKVLPDPGAADDEDPGF